MKGPRPVQTRGCITSADCEGLPSLPVARACPSPRLRTGVKGDRMCAGGTATANSDPREGVRSGQLQHDVKEYVRGHESGDVVGLTVPHIIETIRPEAAGPLPQAAGLLACGGFVAGWGHGRYRLSRTTPSVLTAPPPPSAAGAASRTPAGPKPNT